MALGAVGLAVVCLAHVARAWRSSAPCLPCRNTRILRVYVRPPKGSPYVQEGRGALEQQDWNLPDDEINFHYNPYARIDLNNSETTEWLWSGKEDSSPDYDPMIGYAGTCVPSIVPELYPRDELPKRVIHPWPAFQELPFHARAPVTHPRPPPSLLFLELANRTSPKQKAELNAERDPYDEVVIGPFHTLWDAERIAKMEQGQSFDPAINPRRPSWGRPQSFYADDMPFFTPRYPSTLTAEDYAEMGVPDDHPAFKLRTFKEKEELSPVEAMAVDVMAKWQRDTRRLHDDVSYKAEMDERALMANKDVFLEGISLDDNFLEDLSPHEEVLSIVRSYQKSIKDEREAIAQRMARPLDELLDDDMLNEDELDSLPESDAIKQLLMQTQEFGVMDAGARQEEEEEEEE